MTGRITRLEALVRWHSAEKGVILPAAFIPIAEETGLILPVGDHVLRTACRKLKEWQVNFLPDLIVAVNVSARQFRDPSLLPTIDRALTESGLSPEHLEVEITESIAMESAEIVVGNLEALPAGVFASPSTTSGQGIPRSITSSATRSTLSRSTAPSSRRWARTRRMPASYGQSSRWRTA
jgi:hypothetical protein